MYRFHTKPPGALTCRFWLLSPTGCRDRFCKYAHAITGFISPPSSFACYAYNNGGCCLSQEQCLFAHLFTGPQHQYLQIHHPQLALRDFPIVEAAAKAGFDCGSWPKLKNLIDAVRKAKTPSYPDRWSGPAAFSSPIYPDRYSAEQQRARKCVTQAYKDADVARAAASVPAFVVPAKQLIENARNVSRVPGRLTPSVGKRNLDNFIDLAQDARKRLKTEEHSYSQETNHARASTYIDLTPDKPLKTHSQIAAMNRPALGNLSNSVPRPGTGKHFAKKQRKRDREQRYKHIHMIQENGANEKTAQTIAIIARVASRLHATAADIDTDRDMLRQRWEIDDDLRDQDVTNDLGELNVCFTRAESAIMDGVAVIEGRLLLRR